MATPDKQPSAFDKIDGIEFIDNSNVEAADPKARGYHTIDTELEGRPGPKPPTDDDGLRGPQGKQQKGKLRPKTNGNKKKGKRDKVSVARIGFLLVLGVNVPI